MADDDNAKNPPCEPIPDPRRDLNERHEIPSEKPQQPDSASEGTKKPLIPLPDPIIINKTYKDSTNE